MSLDALAKEISASAKHEAEAIVVDAKAEASQIEVEASEESAKVLQEILVKTEREVALMGKELQASAKQSNQKEILIAKRQELDKTWEELLEIVGSGKLPNRGKMIKSLLSNASEEGSKDMILRPVAIDRKFIVDESKEFKIGTDIEGLGGFSLENADGTISLDFRFESRLESAWNENLEAIRDCLFS